MRQKQVVAVSGQRRIMVGLMLLILSVGTGVSLAATQTLRVILPTASWYTPYVEKRVAAFEAAHPGVTVQLHKPGQMVDAILAEFAGNVSSDVLLLGSIIDTQWQNVLGQGFVRDLTPYMQAEKGFSANEFFPPALNAFKHKGKLVGVPIEVSTAATYVNRKLFEEVGATLPGDNWNWNDMLVLARRMTKDKNGDGRIDQWGFGSDGFGLGYFGATPFLWSNGGDIVNA